MAQLPNLDTTVISTIAYHDIGVPITKSDILPHLESFTEYDNGIDGTILIDDFLNTSSPITPIIDVGKGVRVNVRVRTDGVLLAWNLRANEQDGVENANQETAVGASPVNGQRSLFFPNWNNNSGGYNVKWTFLSLALRAMEQLVVSGLKTEVTADNVQYYDYEYPNVNTIYILSGNGGGATDTGTFTEPASGTSIRVFAAHGWNSSATADTTINGHVLLDDPDGGAQYNDSNFADFKSGGALLNSKTVANNLVLGANDSNDHIFVSIWVEE